MLEKTMSAQVLALLSPSSVAVHPAVCLQTILMTPTLCGRFVLGPNCTRTIDFFIWPPNFSLWALLFSQSFAKSFSPKGYSFSWNFTGELWNHRVVFGDGQILKFLTSPQASAFSLSLGISCLEAVTTHRTSSVPPWQIKGSSKRQLNFLFFSTSLLI